MPRANRRRVDEPRGVPGRGVDRSISAADGDWTVRSLRGDAGGKTYRCPGCRQEIDSGVPHLVVWPSRGTFSAGDGVSERRHWHRTCFEHRGRRW